jgi:hypothetical protein
MFCGGSLRTSKSSTISEVILDRSHSFYARDSCMRPLRHFGGAADSGRDDFDEINLRATGLSNNRISSSSGG